MLFRQSQRQSDTRRVCSRRGSSASTTVSRSTSSWRAVSTISCACGTPSWRASRPACWSVTRWAWSTWSFTTRPDTYSAAPKTRSVQTTWHRYWVVGLLRVFSSYCFSGSFSINCRNANTPPDSPSLPSQSPMSFALFSLCFLLNNPVQNSCRLTTKKITSYLYFRPAATYVIAKRN